MNNKETRTLENSKKHIDNWLSQQFEDFTPNPDAGLWQSIDSALDRKERRSKFIWYWLAAGVLLSVVGVGAFQWNAKNNATQNSVAVAQHQVTKNSADPTSVENSSASENVVNGDVAADYSSRPGANNTQKSDAKSKFTSSKKVDAKSSTPLNRTWVHPEILEETLPVLVDVPVEVSSPELKEEFNTDQQPFDFINEWAIDQNQGAYEIASPNALPWQRIDRKPLIPGLWSVEIGADANQTGLVYRAKTDYGQYIHKNYFDRMRSGEFALSASRLQGALLYQIAPKHALKIGLAYAENRTQQRFDFRDSMPATVIQGQKTDALGYYPIFGYLGLGPQVTFESRSTYTMLSIPVGYTGHFPWKQGLSITPEILVSANRLGVSAGAQTLDYQTLLQKSQQADQFRTWVMGMRVAVGVEKRLSYAHAIGLRLNAQSMLSPMYVPNAALESRGWSAGLSAHYSWRIQ